MVPLAHARTLITSAPRTLETREDLVTSASGTLGTREDSAILASGALGTPEHFAISVSGTLGKRQDVVISASSTLGTQQFKITRTLESMVGAGRQSTSTSHWYSGDGSRAPAVLNGSVPGAPKA